MCATGRKCFNLCKELHVFVCSFTWFHVRIVRNSKSLQDLWEIPFQPFFSGNIQGELNTMLDLGTYNIFDVGY